MDKDRGTPSRRLGRPPKRDSPPTRERILTAALELFAQQGYAGTSVRQIAQKVGLSESALYAHFTSKQQIYETLLAAHGPPLVAQAIATVLPMLSHATPRAIMDHLVHAVLDSWDDPQARLSVSLFLQELGQGTEEVRQGVLASVTQVQQQLGALLQGWIDAGRIHLLVSPEDFVWELFTPLVYLRFLYLTGQATASTRQEGRHVAQHHIAVMFATFFQEVNVRKT